MMKPPSFWKKPNFLATLLRPLSGIYSLAEKLRRFFTRPYKTSKPVICVGNVIMGGAGKTPVVLALIDILKEQGYIPHILSRGYGGRLKGPVLVSLQHHTARDVGDEPLLLAQKAPTWVGRNRILTAKAALNEGATVLIMDDGFQNPSLYKDLSLLVINTNIGHGNGYVFPAGPLREPLEKALKRTQAIIHIGTTSPLYLPTWCGTIFQGDMVSLNPLPPQRCVAFAGIGDPQKFLSTLQKAGLTIAAFFPYADHHVYSEKELRFLIGKAEEANSPLITTAKDYVRLPSSWQSKIHSWEIQFHIEKNFKNWLSSQLEK